MNDRPLLYDLFCGAGGAAMGYHRAGFEVVGVDNKPQKNYPFDFIQMDALGFLQEVIDGERPTPDVIHASPPCQLFSQATRAENRQSHINLIPQTRELCKRVGSIYVIENVPKAPLINWILICGGTLQCSVGTMQLHRHRLFESNAMFFGMPCSQQKVQTITVVGNGTPSWSRAALGRNPTIKEKREAMGIDWMNRNELSQAIPPAYTEFIGKQLIQHIKVSI